MAIGRMIRAKREELKLTLDEVSRQTGYSKPYLSTIETGRVKNPPADDLLAKLEDLLGFESGVLIYAAHMERLPADVRQAFESSVAENDHWRALIARVIDAPASLGEVLSSDDMEQVYQRVKQAAPSQNELRSAGKLVPIINNVSAGYPVDYDDKGYPVGSADDYIRAPEISDPNAFAVRVVGDSMEPKYRQGDIIVFAPNREVNNGDDCFVRMKDPHETTFKQVYFEADGRVRLQPRNQKYPPLYLPSDRVNGIYRAVMRSEQID